MLKNVEDPEQKRELIGDKFAEVFEKVMADLKSDPENTFLIQGTLYTDTIESGHGVGDKADIIKTHHNVGSPRIKMMRDKGLVVEPNRWIYKDEVRMVGQLLGLPDELIWRHPFPGPGLAVRLICADKPFFPPQSYRDNIAGKYALKGLIYPVRTVGVQGDERTYKNLVLLCGPNDWHNIRQAAAEIVSSVHSVNRAVFLITGDFPADIDLIAPLHITAATLDSLREADFAANQTISRYGLTRKISQMPVIMFPGKNRPMIAVRDVVTEDFMTVRPLDKPDEMPWSCVFEMGEKIMNNEYIKRTGGLDGVCIDVTDKPPATVEWE
jgi:GMP synthase (glutamine-hydrolysing)